MLSPLIPGLTQCPAATKGWLVENRTADKLCGSDAYPASHPRCPSHSRWGGFQVLRVILKL